MASVGGYNQNIEMTKSIIIFIFRGFSFFCFSPEKKKKVNNNNVVIVLIDILFKVETKEGPGWLNKLGRWI